MAESEDGVGFLGRGSKPPPHQLKGMEKRCKLTQWSPGAKLRKMWFWCISGLEKSSNLDIVGWPFTAFEMCRNFFLIFHFTILRGPEIPPASLK